MEQEIKDLLLHRETFYRSNEDGSFSRVDMLNEFYEDIKNFLKQEIEKARKDIYSEFLEYKKSYIENIWKSGIPDDLIEDTLNNVDDYLKSKLTTK